MPTQAWNLILTFPATMRQKSPFLLIALESQLPWLRLAPLFHLLLLTPRLTSEPPCTILLVFIDLGL